MISNNILNAIEAIDLDPIKLRLTHKSAGEGWTHGKANAMETEYRRFLCLLIAYPGEQAAPTKDVDTFWHYHILDTAKYSSDCEQAFGYFLHHYPYLGLHENDEPGVEERAAEKTRELYELAFGEAYIRAEAYGDNTEAEGTVAARCGGLCVVSPVLKSIKSARCGGLCVRSPAQASVKSAQRQGLRHGELSAAFAQAGMALVRPTEHTAAQSS